MIELLAQTCDTIKEARPGLVMISPSGLNYVLRAANSMKKANK